MQQLAEIKVGIFAIVVVAMGIYTASHVKGGLGSGPKGYQFEIWFRDAPGVGKGTPIRLAGVDIGQVTAKEIINVDESVEQAKNPSTGESEIVTTWSALDAKTRQPVSVVESRRAVTPKDVGFAPYTRKRNLARVAVRVYQTYEMFVNFRYEITGGVMFGDRQLSVGDTGADGLPMAKEVRGASVREIADEGATSVWQRLRHPFRRAAAPASRPRVAVLGRPPASLDQIVNRANKAIDDDAVARIKAIVANVDDTTAEAKRLLQGLRQTVEANRERTDQIFANAAAATNQVKEALSDARGKLSGTMTNVEAATGVAKRYALRNEQRFDKITAQLDSITGRVNSMLATNEPRVSSVMADAAATVRELRSILADNRRQVDEIATQMALASRHVADLTGDARDRLASVIGKVDDGVTVMRDWLTASERQLKDMTADASAVMRNARGASDDVRAITGNAKDMLQKVGTDLPKITSHVEELTGDPALRRTMANAEAATAEARDLLRDIRDITGSPEVRGQLKHTVANLETVSTKLATGVDRFSSYRPVTTATLFTLPTASQVRGDVTLDLFHRKNLFHLELDNIGQQKAWYTVELGRQLRPDLWARYGFYRGKWGIGADWEAWDKLTVRGDLYNPRAPRFDVRLLYPLPIGGRAVAGFEDGLHKPTLLFGFEYGKSFK